jgi:Uma2 family endonuclease
MSVALEPTAQAPLQVLEHVSWETYESFLRDMEEQHVHARITYDQGRMTVMSPLPKHEWTKLLMGQIVGVMALELHIPVCSLGETTWRRKDLSKGLEADQCYYVQHEALVRGRDDLNLNNDPPPDLVIEVDITHHPIDRMQIYAALGVPEVWQFYRDHIQAYKLGGEKYAAIEFSLAFPFLQVSELNRFLQMRWSTDETSIMRAFRDWVVKLPR